MYHRLCSLGDESQEGFPIRLIREVLAQPRYLGKFEEAQIVCGLWIIGGVTRGGCKS